MADMEVSCQVMSEKNKERKVLRQIQNIHLKYFFLKLHEAYA